MTQDSYEIDQDFVAALLDDDDLGSVIRSHIHIENLVEQLVFDCFPRSKYIEKMSLDFHQKVDLAIASGLIETRYRSPLNAPGRLRNKFAHDLSAKISKQEANGLRKSLTSEDRKIVQDSYARTAKKTPGKMPSSWAQLDPGDQIVLIFVTLQAMLRANNKAKG